MFAGVAEDGEEEVAGAVGDFGLFGEVGVALDEYADADDAEEAGDVAV